MKNKSVKINKRSSNNNNNIKDNKCNNTKKYIIVVILVIILAIVLYFVLRKVRINNIKYEVFNHEYSVEYKTKDNGKKYILFTMFRVNECNEHVELVSKNIDDNNNLNLYFDFKYSCGLCGQYDKKFEIPLENNENINEIKAYYRVVSTEKCDTDIDYKPIIYVYPTKEMDLTIKLNNDKLLTHTYPKYNDSWNIHVDTNGNIYDYKTNRNYYALYWEAIDNSEININEGFIIEGKDTIKFLEEKLEYLGLNEREINEFIIYWINKLENNKYNYIRFRCTEEVNKYMPLEFSENPDTLIRIIMDYKPLDKKINIKEQKLEKVLRNGFTVVEWGGRKID